MTDKYYFGMLVEGFLFNHPAFLRNYVVIMCNSEVNSFLNSDYILVN